MMQNLLAIQKGLDKIGGYLSPTKLSSFFAGTIFFFASTQLGYHFWPDSSLVYGIRIDYLSPTIYFLDILIIMFLSLRGLTLKEVPNRETYKTRKVRPYWVYRFENLRIYDLGFLSPLLLTNLLYSQNPLSTLSWSLHFLLYFVFLRRLFDSGQPLGSDLLRRSWLQPKKGSAAGQRAILMGTQTFENLRIDDLGFVLTFSLLFQAFLSLTQVYLGHSVGGLMYYLGERSVAVGAPGIALGSFIDVIVLRAYGTFGHPNVLAGYAVISLLIILQLLPRTLLKRKTWLQAKLGSAAAERRVLIGMSVVITTLLIFLTQSRSAALALFGIILPFYLLKNLKSRIIYFSVSLFVCCLVGSSLLDPSRADLSSTERRALQSVSLKVIQNFPIFGTGAQSSISTYPSVSPASRLLQPDHNSFTLFLSWFGIFGTLALGFDLLMKSWLSAKMFSRASQYRLETLRIYDLRFLVTLSPLLLLDHYLLTSPQGLFILLLYLFVVNYSHAQKNRQ